MTWKRTPNSWPAKTSLSKFLNASAIFVAEWATDAFTVKGALDLMEGLAWPPGAVRMQSSTPTGAWFTGGPKEEGR
jgi:hypothetical protein